MGIAWMVIVAVEMLVERRHRDRLLRVGAVQRAEPVLDDRGDRAHRRRSGSPSTSCSCGSAAPSRSRSRQHDGGMDMALIVEGVWKTFAHESGPQSVLRGMSLEVQPGEFVSLIGHSGCGKSTMLKAIGGLLADRPRRDHARRRGRRRARPRPGDGVPALLAAARASASSTTCATRCGRPDRRRAGGRRRAASATSPPSACGSTGTRSRRKCPAACSSAPPWPGRSRSSRGRCCSTSRSARSTR